MRRLGMLAGGLGWLVFLVPAGYADELVLLDSFQDDTPNGPPNGPEVGSAFYAGSGSTHVVADFGGNDLRLVSEDFDAGGGISITYTPTGNIVQGRTSYVFQVFSNSNLAASNALSQEWIMSPSGTNLWVRWGNDFKLRVHISFAGGGSKTIVTSVNWAFDTDYEIDLRTDALNDTFTLLVDGVPVLFEEPMGTDFAYLRSLNFGSNFSTTCFQVLDDVIMVDTTNPCLLESTPPIAELNLPPEWGTGCACDDIVHGSAFDPDGEFGSYTLRYRRSSGEWNHIETATSPVEDGILGIWNTDAIAEGFYLLELTATNACGLSAGATHLVYVDNDFDTIDIRFPAENQVVARNTCGDGTVWDNVCFDHYTVDYRPTSGGSWENVDPGNPVYSSTVINDPFAWWDTLGVPDGEYQLRVTGVTDCGNTRTEFRVTTVDNTLPTALITDPLNCSAIEGVTDIIGTAFDVNLDYWILQYTGGSSHGWVTIASSGAPKIDEALTSWDTTLLEPCPYTLRLRVYDTAMRDCNSARRQATDYLTSVNVGYCGDFDADNDGDVDLVDYQAFVLEFDGPLGSRGIGGRNPT